ncbi:hypothetical protein EVAR_63908_1 [Eumeta japonica]|uniref:Uncharacterized protein n=1 Tax=Eumeta variegata TaxID=151549 RepID=A0A4C1ZK56_EUMVA|nr:hypothetical protein EVAR_63908_1 [Eumeta japonica]
MPTAHEIPYGRFVRKSSWHRKSLDTNEDRVHLFYQARKRPARTAYNVESDDARRLWAHSSRKQAAGLTDLPAPTAANPRQYFQDFPQIAISSAVLSSTDLRWFGKVW